MKNFFPSFSDKLSRIGKSPVFGRKNGLLDAHKVILALLIDFVGVHFSAKNACQN
jgi:hypothetical protein